MSCGVIKPSLAVNMPICEQRMQPFRFCEGVECASCRAGSQRSRRRHLRTLAFGRDGHSLPRIMAIRTSSDDGVEAKRFHLLSSLLLLPNTGRASSGATPASAYLPIISDANPSRACSAPGVLMAHRVVLSLHTLPDLAPFYTFPSRLLVCTSYAAQHSSAPTRPASLHRCTLTLLLAQARTADHSSQSASS